MPSINTLQVGANLTVCGSGKWTREQKDEWLKSNPLTLAVTINGQPVIAKQKEFSKGSVGYYANGKVSIMSEEPKQEVA